MLLFTPSIFFELIILCLGPGDSIYIEQTEVNSRLAMEAFYIFCLITDKEDRWAVCLMLLCWNRKSTAAYNGGWQNKNMWPLGVKTGESEVGQAEGKLSLHCQGANNWMMNEGKWHQLGAQRLPKARLTTTHIFLPTEYGPDKAS